MNKTIGSRSGFSLSNVWRARAARPGQAYGVPGNGDSVLISFIVIIALVILWWAVTTSGLVEPLFLPSPQAIFEKFVNLSTRGFTGVSLLAHIEISLFRVFSAFLLACIVGVPLGLWMGTSSIVRGIFDPPIEFYRPVPPLAYLPLMIIWFGIGETAKILLIFASAFAPVVLGARSGVKSAAMEQIQAAYSFGATRWQVMSQIIFPAALPEIITAMRVGIGFGWTTLVAAEMVAATKGIGYMVLSAAQFLQTATVIVGIVIIAVIAYGFDFLMRQVERKVVPWKGR